MTKESDIEPEVKQFGLNLRRRREAMGVTVEKLAELSKLSPSALSGIESGEYEPSLSEVIAITDGLGIKPAVLFGAPEEHSALAEEAGRKFEELKPDVQNAMLALLHTVMKPGKK
jgi:transcriptional regulator with XRE-family HTH domain